MELRDIYFSDDSFCSPLSLKIPFLQEVSKEKPKKLLKLLKISLLISG
jgi:hypothetical protein